MGLPWDAVLDSTGHTALTDLGAVGVDAFTIQAVAGHASVTTFQRYVHPVRETMMRAIETRSLARLSLKIVGKRQAAATVSATPIPAELVAAAK